VNGWGGSQLGIHRIQTANRKRRTKDAFSVRLGRFEGSKEHLFISAEIVPNIWLEYLKRRYIVGDA